MRYHEIKIGKTTIFKKKITSEMIEEFAKVTGDFNQIHMSDNYAKKTVFKHRIAHGFLYGSFISMILGTLYPGQGTVYLYQDMKFLHPVYINDTLEVRIIVKKKLENNKVKLITDIYNQNDILVLTGTAVVSVPK